MTIKDFKRVAEMTHNNKENACNAWGRGWGLGTMESERWAYKEHTFKGVDGRTFVYRSGDVLMRHGSYSRTDYIVNGEQVSRAKFLKAFEDSLSGGYGTKVA